MIQIKEEIISKEKDHSSFRDCEKINRSIWVSETAEMSKIVTPPIACYEQGTIYRQINDLRPSQNDQVIFSQSLNAEEMPKALPSTPKKRNLKDMMISFEILSSPVSLRQQYDQKNYD